MTMYALVRNNAVTLTGDLPVTYKRDDGTSVSGYNTLSDAQVKVDGWLPLIENRPALTTGQSHGTPTYTITANSVTADYPVQPEPITATNRRDLEAKLALLISEAAAATALLQAQRDTANLATGTLTTAVLSTAARQLQAAVKEQAMVQQAHIKRTVAIARLATDALDETTGT